MNTLARLKAASTAPKGQPHDRQHYDAVYGPGGHKYESMNNKYRKKPVVIEAIQLSWKNWNEVCDFTGSTISPENPARSIPASEASDTCGEVGPEYIAFDVTTVHGEKATVRHGDWIIPDGKPGTFYPCKPDIFEATYEPAH